MKLNKNKLEIFLETITNATLKSGIYMDNMENVWLENDSGHFGSIRWDYSENKYIFYEDNNP